MLFFLPKRLRHAFNVTKNTNSYRLSESWRQNVSRKSLLRSHCLYFSSLSFLCRITDLSIFFSVSIFLCTQVRKKCGFAVCPPFVGRSLEIKNTSLAGLFVAFALNSTAHAQVAAAAAAAAAAATEASATAYVVIKGQVSPSQRSTQCVFRFLFFSMAQKSQRSMRGHGELLFFFDRWIFYGKNIREGKKSP